MHRLFSPPSIDDLIRLLRAWRFWSVGALIGALLGAGLYYIAPPAYRAHAIVLVDFNLEQAWPKDVFEGRTTQHASLTLVDAHPIVRRMILRKRE